MDGDDEALFGRPSVAASFPAQYDGIVLLTDNFVRPELDRFHRLIKQVGRLAWLSTQRYLFRNLTGCVQT